jgi:fluoride exporter
VTWLLIGLGGAIGAPMRYLVDASISRRARGAVLPWGTVAINLLGSAILGVIVRLTSQHGAAYALAATGLCGAFTTFSTFTWETLALAEDGYGAIAIANVALSLTLGLGAAALTYGLT